MRTLMAAFLAGVFSLGLSAAVLAAPPDEPAGGTPASCAGVSFSDHATGNAASTQREVVQEEIPALLELTALTRGELYELFVTLHELSHEDCEGAFLDLIGA